MKRIAEFVGILVLANLQILRLLFSVRTLPLTGLYVVAIVAAASSQQYQVRFFEIAAQVIPVLLLVLGIELRLFDTKNNNIRVRWGPPATVAEFRRRIRSRTNLELQAWASRFLVLGGLVVAEIVALRVVAYQEPGKAAQAIVFGSIVGGLVMLALVALGRFE